MAHGGHIYQRTGKISANPSRDCPLKPRELVGFSHWPRDPTPHEQCRLTELPGWPDTISTLARFLYYDHPWDAPLNLPGKPPVDVLDNPFIPSGYTYARLCDPFCNFLAMIW